MSPALFWALLILLIGYAAFARFYDLNADPPAYFANGSQDLTTDGAYLTMPARQAVLFGEWNLFGYAQWIPFRVSIVSGVSYLLFLTLGVTRQTANIAGALLGLGGVVLFIGSFLGNRSRRFILILALFLCSSFMLTTFGRLPFSENGLLFLAGMAFFVYVRWFHTAPGKVAVGVLIALCGLLGKSFGFLLGVGPIFAILFDRRERRARDLALLIGSMLVTFALLWGMLYREQGFFAFLWEHGAGVHGFPHGFTSPKAFLESFITYGRNGLHSYSAVVSLLCYVAALTLALGTGKALSRDKALIFAFGWFGSWALVMSPFNYLPLRYLMPLFVPMSIVAASFLDDMTQISVGGFKRLAWWRVVLVLIATWLFLYYALMEFVIKSDQIEAYNHLAWVLLPFAAAATLVLWLVFRRKTISFSGRTSTMILAVSIAAIMISEGYREFRWLGNRIYSIDYACRDVGSLLDSRAVVAGQYGPAFTANSAIRNFPLFVSADDESVPALLRQFPVTHLVIGDDTWSEFIARYPAFASARPLTRFWVRDKVVVLVRVAELTGNPEAMKYKVTDYEQADLALVRHQGDSAVVYLRRFVDSHPNCRAGLADLYYLRLGRAPYGQEKELVDQIADVISTDFGACMLGAIYYKWLGRQTNDQADVNRSQLLLQRAIRLNPRNESNFRHMLETYKPSDRVL